MILARSRGGEGLEPFARGVFALLKVADVLEHDSSNYLGSTYFRGAALGLSLAVARCDHSAFRDFEYWLVLDKDGPWVSDRTYLWDCGDMIARILARAGYEVCCPMTPEDWAEEKSVVRRLRYRWNPSAPIDQRIEILTEEVPGG